MAALLILLLAACASFEPRPLAVAPPEVPVQAETAAGVTVQTAILTDAQAEQVYGVDLASVGLQAIWLRIENNTDHSFWLLVSALDPGYFPPNEASVLFQLRLSETDERRLEEHVRSLAIPLRTDGGEVSEGYVLAPRREGGRYVEVRLRGRDGVLRFDFGVALPDDDFDFASLQPSSIYVEQTLPELSAEELRQRLRELPCCTTDADQEGAGDPLNLVLVGSVEDVLASLSRGGWSFTQRLSLGSIKRMVGAAISGEAYPVAPVSPLYFMGRPQDVALQLARNTIVQRNHLRLWLAPFRYRDDSVWVGQVSRDISVKADWGSLGFVTHVIDPNVDEAREHLLQSLLVSGAVLEFGFAEGVGETPMSAPRSNLSGDPWYSDGLRLLAVVTGTDTVAPEEVIFLDWGRSDDPAEPDLPGAPD